MILMKNFGVRKSDLADHSVEEILGDNKKTIGY